MNKINRFNQNTGGLADLLPPESGLNILLSRRTTESIENEIKNSKNNRKRILRPGGDKTKKRIKNKNIVIRGWGKNKHKIYTEENLKKEKEELFYNRLEKFKNLPKHLQYTFSTEQYQKFLYLPKYTLETHLFEVNYKDNNSNNYDNNSDSDFDNDSYDSHYRLYYYDKQNDEFCSEELNINDSDFDNISFSTKSCSSTSFTSEDIY